VIIRAEVPGDEAAVAALHDAAFGSEAGIPALVRDLRLAPGTHSLVAEQGEVIGHVAMSAAWLDAPQRLVDVLVLSPIGVRPKAQGQGIGTKLLAAARAAAEAAGAPLLFLEGRPDFYGTRGFVPACQHRFRRPSTRIPRAAFQVALLPGHTGLTGTLVYRDVHWRHGVGLYPSGA